MWDSREVRGATLPDLIRMCAPLAQQLEVSIRRQDATTPQGERRSSDAVPMVFRIGAAEVRDEITTVLRSILGEWIREQEAPVYRMLSVPELVARLHPLRSWVVKHGQAEVWRERLVEQCLKALEQIDIPPERVFAGSCPNPQCGVELWPVMGEDVMVCPNPKCKAQVDVRARRREGLRRIEAYEAPLSRVVDTLRAAGEVITYEQARKWTTRRDVHGRVMLHAVGQDQRGARLYRLGDVRAVMLRTTRRKVRTARQ